MLRHLGSACVLLVAARAAMGAAPAASYSVTLAPNVTYAEGLINCPDGADHDPEKRCTSFPLLLDVYMPDKAPPGRPALVLAHGGGNSGGTKEQNCFQGTARFYASRGFVAFNIDYRLSGQKGTYPQPGNTADGWNPSWPSAYPAVRDFKAAGG
jgi:acetyl esterase/lipase